MSAGFKKEILLEKLAKLDNLQSSIETLSHWCAFHHHHCRQVVETWDSEYRSASCHRKVFFLYLANDIMQNSRKGSNGYIPEFMRVIPAALKEVFDNGDDSARRIVKRLVDIWEDRKIFDIQGRSLQDDFFRRLKDLRSDIKKPGELLEKVVSSYKNATIDEGALMRKCQASLGNFDNLSKAYENNSYSGSSNGSGFVKELQEQHSIIRNSIEQLQKAESLRATLIFHLKEALNEQELKVEQVRSQLQAAQSRYKKANELCQELGIDVGRHQPSNRGLKRSSLSETPVAGATYSANVGSLPKGQSSAVMYSQEGHGNVMARFAANAASEEMLTGAFPPRANGNNISQKLEQYSSFNKRQKVEDGTHISHPQSQPQPPPPPFPHPDTFQPPPPPYPPSPEPSPPPPPTAAPPSIIPPPPPILTPPQIISPMGGGFVPFPVGPPIPMTAVPYDTFPPYTPVVNFPMTNMPPGFSGAPNPPPAFHGLGGPFYGPPQYPAVPPPTVRK